MPQNGVISFCDLNMKPRITHHRLLPYLLLLLSIMAATLIAGRAEAQSTTTLRVATKELAPFVYLSGEEPTGYSIDLWAEIARRLDLTYQWQEYETVGEILAAVETGAADVAIAGISMTREREEIVDFTHPFYDAGLQILVPAQASFSPSDTLRQFFSPGLLVFVVIAFVAGMIMAHFIYFAERRHNPDFQHGYWRGLWEAVWWLLTIVASGAYPGERVDSARRLITIAFWLIGLLLVAQFTATVTSALTVQRLNSDVDGPEDLPGRRVATVTGSTAESYLTARNVLPIGVATIDEAYALLLAGEVDAVVYDAPVLRYYSVTTGSGVVALVGPLFKPEKYGIALPHGSELREPINEVLLEMYQDGTLQQIEEAWFSE